MKAKHTKPLTIKTSDIKVRRDWGKVRPFSVKFKDLKKEGNKKACRGRVTI